MKKVKELMKQFEFMDEPGSVEVAHQFKAHIESFRQYL